MASILIGCGRENSLDIAEGPDVHELLAKRSGARNTSDVPSKVFAEFAKALLTGRLADATGVLECLVPDFVPGEVDERLALQIGAEVSKHPGSTKCAPGNTNAIDAGILKHRLNVLI